MGINICKNFDYEAEKNRYRREFASIYSLGFLVKALFGKNAACVSDTLFHGKTVELDDIVYYVNDGKPDFMYIIKVDELKYLMNSSFSVVSDGYHQIVQLYDKIPRTYGYIAVKKPEVNGRENTYLGILNENGKEVIECKYLDIRPIICRTVLQHDGDYMGGLSDHREDLLFFSCTNCSRDCDVYTYNGTLVFENIDRINKTEEKICYNYDCIEDTWWYTETKQIEKIHVGLVELPEENCKEYQIPYVYRYVYRVSLYGDHAELGYIGLEEDDKRCLEDQSDDADRSRVPEIPVPKISRIEIDTGEDAFKVDKRILYDFLKRITEDVTIYNYIEDDEVDLYFKIYFFPETDIYRAGREEEALKRKKHEEIVDALFETIEDHILGIRSEERKKQLEIGKTKRLERENAERLEEKNKRQSQITLDTKVADCYFGDRYNSHFLKNEMTIGELRSLNGESVFRFCYHDKKLFEEIVTVLLSHHIYLVDYSPMCNIQSYFEKIYEKEVCSITIDELDFSFRTCVCLKRANIYTVEDLTQHTEDEIKKIRNLGNRSFEEILKKLAGLGVSFKQDS